MPCSSGMADTTRPHGTAWAGNMGSMPGVQSSGAGESQPMQGFQTLQQLQSLPGISPNQSALQAFDGAFLRQVAQTAPKGQVLLNAVIKPVHPEPEEQVHAILSLSLPFLK